jgi:sugar/nucleoside kinase (ribokinase family)
LRHLAAERAAKLNADAGKEASYDHDDAREERHPRRAASTYRLTSIPAASIDPEAVVDTTGAGDAFIGTMLFSVAMGLGPAKGARLASVVAAAKCLKLGARPGLVRLTDVDFAHGAREYLNI